MSVLAIASSWSRRIHRADVLAGTNGPAAPLLTFYARVLRAQKVIYESLTDAVPSGAVEHEVRQVAANSGALLQDVIDHGPEPLAAQARTLLDAGEPVITRLLLEHLRTSSDRPFFAKALLQPYGEWLAASTLRLPDEPSAHPENRCPRCGGPPQLSVLSPAGTTGDGSSRQLQCANCLSLWFFRRVRCPSCGEEDERQLGYFHSPAHDHVRVDACDHCRRYIKSVDLGQLGLAVPLVDEVSAAALDAWACDRGYDKIEMNLLGL